MTNQNSEFDNLVTKINNMRHLADSGDSQIMLTPYDIKKLMDDVREVLLGIDYPSVATFKHVTYGLVKGYLRGRRIRADGKNCTIVFKKLLRRSLSQQGSGCGWFLGWCKSILDGEPEKDLTPADQLMYGQMTFTKGTPRPVYPIGNFGDIIVPDTPGGPLVLSIQAPKIVFKDIGSLVELVNGFWDTVNHIERTYSPIEEDGIPLSYAYRAIQEWDQVAKETLDCEGHRFVRLEAEDP